jgi:8-amino-7-oxononanoate synthase
VNLDNWLNIKLSERKAQNLFRTLKSPSGLLDFCSNDYLGLARSKELTNLINNKLEKLNLPNGATGSRLLSGNSVYTEEVEQKLSSIFKSESSLIFNSGYTANLAVLSSIPQKGDTILYDELAHACIKDGARLSLSNRYSFKHNNLEDLEQKLKKATGKKFIAVESVYSMDGDLCPLVELVKLAEKYDASIILDEAHSTGVCGVNGSGLATSLGLTSKIAIRVYTFGKGIGCHGACVAGDKNLIEYLINFARPFIYTTALPPHSIASIECAFDYLNNNITLQDLLKKKISLFKTHLHPSINSIESKSSIQAIVIPGNEYARSVANNLQSKLFDVRPILSPTVPQGSERLRICLHTYNTDDEIISLTKALPIK